MREPSSKTSFALAALALVVASMTPASDGLLTESYVRLQLDPDTGGRIVTLVDFERIVNFVFDPDNNIVNCQVAKRNEMGRKMIILEVISRANFNKDTAREIGFITGGRHDWRDQCAVLPAGGRRGLIRKKVLQVPQK